jgi:hypothetical protein
MKMWKESLDQGGGFFGDWGFQAEAARRLGVHRSTVCRDFRMIREQLYAEERRRKSALVKELQASPFFSRRTRRRRFVRRRS